VVFFVPTPSSSELGWVWSRKSPTTSWLGLPWRRGRDCPKRAFPLRERLQGKPYDRFALGVFFALFPRPSKLGSVRERKSPATSWLGLPWRRGRDCPKRAFPLRGRLHGKPYDRFALGVFFALFPRPSKLGSVRERKSPATSWLGLPWRRGRDSNPRYPCGHICFRDRPDRPLWHLSDTGRQI
jgi:hypothetical protein